VNCSKKELRQSEKQGDQTKKRTNGSQVEKTMKMFYQHPDLYMRMFNELSLGVQMGVYYA